LGRGGRVEKPGVGLAREAALALTLSLGEKGWAGVPGWEGISDAQDILEAARGVAFATAPNVNSMLSDFRGARVSEIDFISGAMVDILINNTVKGGGGASAAPAVAACWNHRMLASISSREWALGIRDAQTEEGIRGIIAGARWKE